MEKARGKADDGYSRICGDVNVNAFGGSRQDVLRISTFGLRTGFEGSPHIGRDLAYNLGIG